MKKIIIILTLIVSTLIYLEIKNNEVVIPDSAIRLRVIPNSNTSVDQNTKNITDASITIEPLNQNVFKQIYN